MRLLFLVLVNTRTQGKRKFAAVMLRRLAKLGITKTDPQELTPEVGVWASVCACVCSSLFRSQRKQEPEPADRARRGFGLNVYLGGGLRRACVLSGLKDAG